jgi:hypothetical protein
MGNALNELMEKARSIKMTPKEIQEQRVSFVYGNTNIENSRITKQMVEEIDAKLNDKLVK